MIQIQKNGHSYGWVPEVGLSISPMANTEMGRCGLNIANRHKEAEW